MTFLNKVSRKEFLKISALAVGSTFLTRFDAFGKPIPKIGLQLYTLRNELPKNLEGTLKKVADIGYKEVELFGYSDRKFFGKTATEFKAILKGTGLSAPSGHYGTGTSNPDAKGTMTNGWEAAVEDAASIGQKYMVCAYLVPQERTSLDQYKKHAELFNKSAEICKKSGIQFAYHNHDFEFKTIDGQIPYDLLLKQTDPKLVQMELDLYWISFAGMDPVKYFNENPGRFPMVHVKDMAKTDDRGITEVGAGSIDFQRILDAGKTAGLKHYFVEEDVFTGRTAFDAIQFSFNNVKKFNI